jgi:CheY-like chemotaxis protein
MGDGTGPDTVEVLLVEDDQGDDLKADRDLLVIPVLVLTTSAAPPDIQRSYSPHGNAYITKPADFDSFTDAINQIASWFLGLIKLPRTW